MAVEYVCIHVGVTSVHVCPCACGGQTSAFDVFYVSQLLPTLFLRQYLSVSMGSSIWLDWQASELGVLLNSLLQSWDYKCVPDAVFLSGH